MKMRKRWLWLLTVLVIPVGYAGIAISGNLEPSDAPGSTMRTLEEVQPAWSKKITDASKRFKTAWAGGPIGIAKQAILDTETGLVWEASPSTTTMTWAEAVNYAYQKEVGGRKGWRLPTIEELASLLQDGGLPSGHPFTNVAGLSGSHWSSTTDVSNASVAWSVFFGEGFVVTAGKGSGLYVWCVRGGHGYDAR